MDKLKHVKPLKEHEKDAINYIKEFYKYNSNINGSGGLDRYLDDYDGWLKKLEDDRNRIPNEEKVPAETYFLVRESDNKIVGIIVAITSKVIIGHIFILNNSLKILT